MMRKIIFFFVIKVLFLSVSFAQTASMKEGCVPLEVHFDAPATAVGYFWDFKDGVTSNRKSPVNIFNKAGTYQVSFQETPSGPVLGTLVIKVYEAPVLKMAATTGCAPFLTQFQNLTVLDSAGIKVTGYNWVFGDGQTLSGIKNPAHLYQRAGKYTVSLSIQTVYPNCNRTDVFPAAVEISSPPIASFTTSPPDPIFCSDSAAVQFIATTVSARPLRYSWDFGNGDTASKAIPDTQLFRKGTFNPTLSVFFGDDSVCKTVVGKKISVYSSLSPDISIKDTACTNSGVAIQTTAQGIYKWKVSPAVPFADSVSQSTTITFKKTGTYQVSLQLLSADSICSATVTKRIFIDTLSVKILSSSSFNCEKSASIQYTGVSDHPQVNYLWTVANRTDTARIIDHTFFSVSSSLAYTINKLELLPVILSVSDPKSGCTASVSRIDTLFRPTARFTANVNMGCYPLKVDFIDKSTTAKQNPIRKWHWIFGDGKDTVLTTSGLVGHTYTTPGHFFARLITETKAGCNDTSDLFHIQTGTDVTGLIDFTADKRVVCPGETIIFTALLPPSPPLVAYYLSSGGHKIEHCVSNQNFDWQYNDETGFKDVGLFVSHNGCISSVGKEDYIFVKGAIGHIGYESFCSQPTDYHFKGKVTSAGSYTAQWRFGDGATAVKQDTLHTYASSGDYKVFLKVVSDTGNCAAMEDSLTISVRRVKAQISVDSTYCRQIPRNFSAKGSVDVAPDCHSGYTWQFPTLEKTPYTTSLDTAIFRLPQKGQHQIRLIAKDVNGCRDTASATVRVYDIYPKGISSRLFVCPPEQVQFSDSSSGDTSLTKWEWAFGDSTNSVAERHPVHLFQKTTKDSVYHVTLKVTDTLGCSKTFPVKIVQYRPVSKLTVSDTTLCFRDSVSLSASDFIKTGSNLRFNWHYGDGRQSVQQTNSIIYDTVGDFRAKLYYQEIASGCHDSAQVRIQVQQIPQANFVTSTDSLKVLCAPQNITFQDKSITGSALKHNWNFGNGAKATTANYSLFYPKGSYVVSHKVSTGFGCTDSLQRSYKVLSPEGNFDVFPGSATICKGDSVRFVLRDTIDVAGFTWAFGDGAIRQNVSPVSHRYSFHPPSGLTKARLVLQGQEGCIATVEKNVSIYQVIADFRRVTGADTSICLSEGTYQFTNISRSGDQYSWDFGDGTTSVETNPKHVYAQPGSYKVQLSISNNQTTCRDTLIRQAVILPNPQTLAMGDTACAGKGLRPHVAKASPSSTYKWYTASGNYTSEGADPVLLGVGSSIYTVIETNAQGCSDTSQVNTLVFDPIALRDLDTTIIEGDNVILPVVKTEFFRFQWSTTQDLSCTNCSYPVSQPLKDTRYLLTVTDINGCAAPEYHFNIAVRPEVFVKLPTSFTPNGDGVNDVVTVNGWGIKAVEEFLIFNRWGQMVFSSTKMEEGWDGKLNGQVQNTDVYAYKVKALTWNNKIVYTEGFINLIQ